MLNATQYIVVNLDNKEENNYNTMDEARRALVYLLTLGYGAYIVTLPLHQV